jgi:hypothetical protein
VCEQIKRSPSTSGIPVLLLTGTFEPFDKKRAELAGADGHLTKPFESQLLVARVEELIAARPRVATSEQAGVMDVIAGGEVYRVDPGDTDRMRPVAAPAGATPAAPPPRPEVAHAEPAVPPPPRPVSAPAPEPDPGGSYVGFADVGFGDEEPGIVPDRFDEAASPSTVRLRREDLAVPQAPAVPSFAREPEESAPAATDAGGGFTGAFETEFDLQDEGPSLPTAAAPRAEETGWSPPPEAPPAETWADAPDPEAEAPPEREQPAPAATAPPRALRPEPALIARDAGDGRPAGLSAEAIELIAEKVVARMSDRIVREIAWEIVPEVAEALVRRRIKELEESPAE